MMQWYWIDYVIVAIIALSVITGLFRGFIKELIALCIWVLAIWLAYTYSSYFEHWLLPYIQDQTVRTFVAFIAILLVTLIAGAIFNALLSLILHRSGLSGTDRFLGMGFGFARGVFIVAFIILVIQLTSGPHQVFKEKSQLYAKFDPIVAWLSGYIPEWIKKNNELQSSVVFVDEVKPVNQLKKSSKK